MMASVPERVDWVTLMVRAALAAPDPMAPRRVGRAWRIGVRASKTLTGRREARGVDSIAAAGMPVTVAHGDFHPGNVALVPGRGVVIFDWTDACIAEPVIDLAIWAWWYDERDVSKDHLWALFVDAWERELGVDVAALDRHSVDVVSAAFHVVSYTEILSHLEPTRWPENVDGVRRFLDHLDALAD